MKIQPISHVRCTLPLRHCFNTTSLVLSIWVSLPSFPSFSNKEVPRVAHPPATLNKAHNKACKDQAMVSNPVNRDSDSQASLDLPDSKVRWADQCLVSKVSGSKVIKGCQVPVRASTGVPALDNRMASRVKGSRLDNKVLGNKVRYGTRDCLCACVFVLPQSTIVVTEAHCSATCSVSNFFGLT